jgi:hypothetical protein
LLPTEKFTNNYNPLLMAEPFNFIYVNRKNRN